MSVPDRARARAIVKLASTKTEDNYTKEWLIRDERGTWEKTALEDLEKTEARALELKMSHDEVNDEIAKMMVLRALKAQLASRTKGRKS